MEISALKKLMFFIILFNVSISYYIFEICILPNNVSICHFYELEGEINESFEKYGKVKIELVNFSYKKEVFVDFNESDLYAEIYTKKGYITIEKPVIKRIVVNMKNLTDVKIYLKNNLVNYYNFTKLQENKEINVEEKPKKIDFLQIFIFISLLIFIFLIFKIIKRLFYKS